MFWSEVFRVGFGYNHPKKYTIFNSLSLGQNLKECSIFWNKFLKNIYQSIEDDFADHHSSSSSWCAGFQSSWSRSLWSLQPLCETSLLKFVFFVTILRASYSGYIFTHLTQPFLKRVKEDYFMLVFNHLLFEIGYFPKAKPNLCTWSFSHFNTCWTLNSSAILRNLFSIVPQKPLNS